MKKSKTITNISAIDIFYRLLSNCSIACLNRIAKYLSFIVYRTNNQISRQTRANIRLCLPDVNRKQQEKLIVQSIQHTCCAFIELAALWYHPVEKILSLITIKNIDDNFFEANKAKLIIAPHQGSWEMLNLWLASVDTSYSLYKPARSEKLDHYIYTKRTRNNAVLIPANTTGLRQLLIGLKNKSSCMILPDQRPAKHTAQTDALFFNLPAPTSLLIKRIASKVECNIFIASITRNLATSSFKLTLKTLDKENFLQSDQQAADYLNKSIQQLIQLDIEQYQWSYRRFRVSQYKKTGK